MASSTLARTAVLALVALMVSPCESQTNDDCMDAFVAVIDTYTGDTFTATSDGEADCGASAGSGDVWYQYTAADDGLLTVSACGSGFDTVLSLHSECPGTPGNQIACNDDACGLQSTVSTSVVVGDVIYIRVAGFASSSGTYTLTLTGPAGVPAGGPPIEEFVRGDTNGDGAFDISDPVNLLGILFILGTPAPTCVDASDINDDGAIDISDPVSALATLFVAGTPPLTAPFGACGEDPTADLLDCAEFLLCP